MPLLATWTPAIWAAALLAEVEMKLSKGDEGEVPSGSRINAVPEPGEV